MQSFRFTLHDNDDPSRTLEGIIEIDGGWIDIGFVGYGDAAAAPGYGRPVSLELYDGQLRLVYGLDIDKEEAQIVSLEGARDRLALRLREREHSEQQGPQEPELPLVRRLDRRRKAE